jgi:hypothetical protein
MRFTSTYFNNDQVCDHQRLDCLPAIFTAHLPFQKPLIYYHLNDGLFVRKHVCQLHAIQRHPELSNNP